MIAYSFTVDTGQFNKLLQNLKSNNSYWLRESLSSKEILSLENGMEVTQFDRDGRIFSEEWELRYQKSGDNIQCLLVSEYDFSAALDDISYQSQEVKAVSDSPKAYYVESLKAIVKGETVFQSKHAQILMKEYVFSDEHGGNGYRLCGVR